jgi:hypothetical protein
MNIEQGIMNVEGSKVEIRRNELENSVLVRIPNHYSLFIIPCSIFIISFVRYQDGHSFKFLLWCYLDFIGFLVYAYLM